MDDLLDLFGDRSKAGEEKNSNQAPVELMTQFLLLISERKMSEALALTSEILEFEPHNAMILEYKRSLAIYIQQAKDEGEGEEASESEGKSSDGAEDSESEDSDSNDENEERKTSHK